MKITKKLFTLLLLSGALGMSGCAVTEKSANEPNVPYSSKNYDPVDPVSSQPTSTSSTTTSTKSASREAFKKLANLSEYSANIQNATSLGLSKKAPNARKLRKNAAGENEESFEVSQTLVKTTTDYEAGEASVAENGELGVTFTKIDTSVKTIKIEDQKTLFAALKEGVNDEVIVKKYDDKTIKFKSDRNHEYRVVDRNGNVIYDWAVGEQGQTTTGELETRTNKSLSDYEVWWKTVAHYANQSQNDDGYHWNEDNYLNNVNRDYNDPDTTIRFWADKDHNSIGMQYEEHMYNEYRILDISNGPTNPNVIVDWKSYYNEEELSEEWGGFEVVLDGLDSIAEIPINKLRVQRRYRYEQVYYNEQGQQSSNTNNGSIYRRGNELHSSAPGKITFWADGTWEDGNGYSDERYYCLKDKDGTILVDWTKHEENGEMTFEIDYVDPLTTRDYVVEARSIDAVVTYPAYEGFTYTLLDKDGNAIVENVQANDSRNVSTDKESLVMFDGLIEGEKYTLKYEGYGEETTTEQSTVGGEIDKMYVYNEQFTFVSFVPYGTSERPSDDQLIYEKDGIANYDKRDYYTDNNRQSFIFDNYSGYIYLIKGFHIKYIHNNLLLSSSDNLVYDFKINEDNSLEIYSLFSNASLNYVNFFKDKHGNKVIQNDKLDKYDENTNTYYFVASANADETTRILTAGEFSSIDDIYKKANNMYSNGNNWEQIERERQKLYDLANKISARANGNNTTLNDSNKRYYLTSNNDILYVEYYNNWERTLKRAELIVDNSDHRELTVKDNFYNLTSCGWSKEYIKVSNGYIMTTALNGGQQYDQETQTNYYPLYCQTEGNGVTFRNIATGEGYRSNEYEANNGQTNYFDFTYVLQYDTMLIYNSLRGALYKWSFDDVTKYLSSSYYAYYGDNDDDAMWEQQYYEFKFMDGATLVLPDVSLDPKRTSFLTYDVNGNTSYDIVVEDVDGELEINPYVTGTYEAPQKKIVLQPINRN